MAKTTAPSTVHRTPTPGHGSVLSLSDNHQGIAAGSRALKPQGRFTIEGWIYPTTNTGKQVIFSEGESLFYVEKGELKYQNASGEIASVGAGITAGNWYHGAVVRGGRRPGNTKLLINGTENHNQAAILPILSVGSTYLGIAPDVADSRFQGKLMEVRVWRYGRSLAEIQANMTYFLAGRELGLVRCWTGNEGFGTAIGYHTTNCAGGTVSGDTTWEECEIPIKINLNAQERLTRSTGLEDYGYWFQEMAKQQKTGAEPHFRRGRIWA
jgi:cyanobactin cluster PatC/TenC/TruC protein